MTFWKAKSKAAPVFYVWHQKSTVKYTKYDIYNIRYIFVKEFFHRTLHQGITAELEVELDGFLHFC